MLFIQPYWKDAYVLDWHLTLKHKELLLQAQIYFITLTDEFKSVTTVSISIFLDRINRLLEVYHRG